ncbi:hypothetical protein QYS48_07325 [Marivirga arenosa]|uniref:Uncharacterized protein n=1 Tax=Marivirga arenosa TaxID=3059076 RepID=A0AA49GEN4_9BACT|nr:hypothetical protein [Marivirga sp. ABR2-2]WKK86703.2 hypothetical protein QYS48_07325 [Marivirga sp. ABR2-2]
MKKKLFTLMSIGLFSLTIGFEVYSQGQSIIAGNDKSLAEYSGGGFCCADNDNNDCTQSPDC